MDAAAEEALLGELFGEDGLGGGENGGLAGLVRERGEEGQFSTKEGRKKEGHDVSCPYGENLMRAKG